MRNQADCYDYVRNYYGVPAYIGVRVTSNGREKLSGVIVKATTNMHYVRVRFDGRKHSDPVHPKDLTYEVTGGNQAATQSSGVNRGSAAQKTKESSC